MTLQDLTHSLAKELRAVLRNYKCIAEGQADKRVTVYEQYMPSDYFEEDSYYPCVIVSFSEMEDGEVDSVATYIISVGVFGGYKDDGWRDLFNIAESIRQYLLKDSVICERYVVERPIAYEVLETQPEPFYWGRFGVEIRIPQIRY